MPVKIKICGVTTLEDAQMAIDAGADAIGFMFYESSPRAIDPAAAARIVDSLPPFITKVGVFVDPAAPFVRSILDAGIVNTLQFHGNEAPTFCRQFGRPSIKAFRMKGPDSLRMLPLYDREAWLLDGYVPGKLGGAGATFNWDLAVQARSLGRPIILAGGLTSENVTDAIRKVLPYGVDVSSGVESAPGKKDRVKVKRFIRAVHEANFLLGDEA